MSQATKDKFPQIQWSQMARTKDRIIHHYFKVDVQVLWDIIEDDLPPMIDPLKRAAAETRDEYD